MSTCWEGGGWILSWSNKIIEGTYFRLPSQVRRAATEALPRSGGRHRRRAQAILFFVIKCYHYFSNLWIRLYVCIAILIVTEPWPMSDIFCRVSSLPKNPRSATDAARSRTRKKIPEWTERRRWGLSPAKVQCLLTAKGQLSTDPGPLLWDRFSILS
jgi:hypothetical protein